MTVVRTKRTASVAFFIASLNLFCGNALSPSAKLNHRNDAYFSNDNERARRLRPRPIAISPISHLSKADCSTTKNNERCDDVAFSIDDLSAVEIERLIVNLGRKGRIDQVLKLYRSITKPKIRQVNAAIDACSRSRPVQLELAFEIMKSSPVDPNVYTFGSLMSVCARVGSVEHAINLLKSMEDEYGVAPNAVVFNTAVSACGRADPPQPDMALKLLEQALQRGIRLSSVGYNAAISAVARAGDWQGAVDLLTRMKNDETGMLPRPDVVSYGTVLSAFERAQEWEKLLEYADHMQDQGIMLDALAITSALHACQNLALADKALRYLNLMKETKILNVKRQTAGWQHPGGRRNLRGPDAVAFLLAISACARGGAWLEGLELLDEYSRDELVRNPDVDVSIFTAAINCCEYEGRWKEAFLVLESMRRRSVVPNEVAFAAVIGACAVACSKTTSSETENSEKTAEMEPLMKALRLLNVMRKDETVLSPTKLVFNAAIRTCAEALDFKRALKIYKTMRSDGVKPDVFTFGALMTACERVGKAEGLNKVFGLMNDEGITATDVIYGAAISCCRKDGVPERALLLLQKMVSDGLKPNVATFNTVLMALAESRNTEDIARVYRFMVSEEARPTELNRQSFNIIVRAFAEQKQPNEAEVVLQRMQNQGFVPDVDLYTVVVSAFERTGQPLQALRIMESMRAQGYAFYEDKVLNAAFKRALKMAHMLGTRLSEREQQQKSILEFNEIEQDNEFFRVR